ncbi:MAG: phosphate starvation-inducible protein PhoH [Fusobacteria bacterium]|nr:MAG: phosphate starvation-inducible protein PhoH [Fusobacteriota bacterium]KAF0229736.1 MAG: phosphate starvation-inducible protein [Fusobacteriota bacterium]
MIKNINFEIINNEDLAELCADEFKYIKMIEVSQNIKLEINKDNINISGQEEDIYKGKKIIDVLLGRINSGLKLNVETLEHYTSNDNFQEIIDKNIENSKEAIAFTYDNKIIRAKSHGQKYYIDSINRNDLTFCLGPAGTGKTFLAVLMATEALRKKEVKKIILVRPAVEAGEQLGFLPGDLQEKIQPYIRPLYDSLFFLLGFEQVEKLLERKVIEIAPLAYMRGRTLDDAFIILDEGQNATVEQMKMFLTRFGFNSKVVVTGDPSQNDLKKGEVSGLLHSVELLRGIKGIKIIKLYKNDVFRHHLVKEIIEAYEKGGI